MTTKSLSTAVLSLLGVTSLAWTAEAEEITERPTHDQLQGIQVKQRAAMEPKANQAEDREDAQQGPRARKPADLVGRSTILSFGGTWTIVPKGAVLHVPQAMRGRVDVAHEGTFVAWRDFYTRNRGWIHLQSVKMEQARGEKALAEDVTAAYARIGRVVVAVCHGGPISIRPPVEKAPAPTRPTGPIPITTP